MNQEKLIQELEKQVAKIDNLLKKHPFHPDFYGWKSKTKRLLERIDGENSSYVKDFEKIKYTLFISLPDTPEYEYDEAYKGGLYKAKSVLSNIIDELKNLGFPETVKRSKDISKITNQIIINNQIENNIFNSIQNQLNQNLTVNQYKQLQEILSLPDKKEKSKRLKEFFSNLAPGLLAELLKEIFINLKPFM